MSKKKRIRHLNEKEKIPAEIVIPTNKVLYIDLDGTLIDGKYQITSNEITDVVQMLQNNGWIIGLSSDTPLEPLRTWRQRFAMNGDIIAERGSVLEIDGQVFDNRDDVESFQSALDDIRRVFSSMGCKIWVGDTVEFLRNGEKIGDFGETVILINAHRTQSIRLYVRSVGIDGNLEINTDLTNKMVDSVRHLFPKIDDLNEDLNHDYGILILSRKAVVKRLGTINAMSQRNLIQVGMIGNSITDFVGSDIALHYAVSNASPEFQKQSDYVASKPFTDGVVEILKKLQRIR